MTDYRHTNHSWDGSQRCPNCGSDNIDYDDSGEYDEHYYYKMFCTDCDAVFTQWYRMVPDQLEWSTEEEWTADENAAREIMRETATQAYLHPEGQPIRPNYNLAKDWQEHESENPLLDILSEVQATNSINHCRCTSGTQDLRVPHANWQAINEALQDS